MPKKKIKQGEYVTDAGLLLDEEQAATVRMQTYEGSYSLGAPKVTTTEDSITVEVRSTGYTAHGDSSLLTTVRTRP